MELDIFARFHARPGNETAVAAVLREGLAPTQAEPGCLSIRHFRSIRDPQLFWIHSRWKDEAAFELHATLPHTVRFLERVQPLIDHPLDITRAQPLLRDGAHDFDFQTGRWLIRNERLKERLKGCAEWETFEATQEARLLPGGLGNVDDFVTDHWPGFVGMSLRLYSPRTRQWSIYWASNRGDGLDAPVIGSFDEHGVGIFEGHQELEGRTILVRFTWSRITPTSARWEQDFSPDEGKTWEKNWVMTMTRSG